MEETEAWSQDSNPSLQDSKLVHLLSAVLRDRPMPAIWGLSDGSVVKSMYCM